MMERMCQTGELNMQTRECKPRSATTALNGPAASDTAICISYCETSNLFLRNR